MSRVARHIAYAGLVFTTFLGSCKNTSAPGTGADSGATGRLSVWTDNVNPVSVSVDGAVVGATTVSFTTAAPACGQAGTVTVTLSAGIHAVSGVSGPDNWTGNITIPAEGCVVYKMQAAAVATSGQVSFWTDLSVGTIDLTIDGASAGTIPNYFLSTPNCGQTGTRTVTLSAGSHAVTGVGGGKSWSKTVNAVAGTCTLVKMATSEGTSPTQLSIYTDQVNGPVTVDIDGVNRGSLTSHYPPGTVPACGQSGTLTVTVTAGSHLVDARDPFLGRWSKTVTAVSGACTMVKLEASTTGQLVIWSDQSGGTITVTVDGVVKGTITTRITSTPTCGQAGALTVTLSPGSHVVSATSSNGSTWAPIANNVFVGECSTLKLAAGGSGSGSTGQLALWKTYVFNLSTVVDGVSRGTLTSHITSGSPSCGDPGTITLTLPVGTHTVSGTGADGTVWSATTVTVYAGACSTFEFRP